MGLGEPFDLRAERLNRGKSQDAIAEEIGISRRVWQRAEEGKGVHPEHALLIATYFEVQVTDIWPVEARV